MFNWKHEKHLTWAESLEILRKWRNAEGEERGLSQKLGPNGNRGKANLAFFAKGEGSINAEKLRALGWGVCVRDKLRRLD